jgi:NAD(P)H-flavin reductase
MNNNVINSMLPDFYRIKKMNRETYDTFTMELSKANGEMLPSFKAGQFNMLYVFGVGEIPMSISSDPHKSKTLLHTTRAVGTVSKAMGKLKRGDQLGVRGPFGSPWPLDDSMESDIVIIAGGIGLAPLRSAIYEIFSKRQNYGNIALLYGTRSPEDVIYSPEIEKWESEFDIDIHVTVDHAIGNWNGHVGVVTTLIPKATFDPPNTMAMICGPEIMMRYSAMGLENLGVKAEKIFVSMERNMKCAIGFCGRCQFGPNFICKDGPVLPYSRVKALLGIWEI